MLVGLFDWWVLVKNCKQRSWKWEELIHKLVMYRIPNYQHIFFYPKKKSIHHIIHIRACRFSTLISVCADVINLLIIFSCSFKNFFPTFFICFIFLQYILKSFILQFFLIHFLSTFCVSFLFFFLILIFFFFKYPHLHFFSSQFCGCGCRC